MSKYISAMAVTGFMMAAAPAVSQTTPSQPGQLPSSRSPAATAPAPAPTAVTKPVRASGLLKASVRNAGGDKVADVSDLLVEPDGKVTHVILGVGGFLGIGERNVAVDLSSLKLMQDSGNRLILTSDKMSPEDVKAMPEWRDPSVAASSSATSPPASPTAPKAPPQ